MRETDILIIGSGPAGISAAWPMVRAGLSVTMIDAANGKLPSSPVATSFSAWRQNKQKIYDVLGEDFGGLADNGDYSPKFSTPLGRAILMESARRAPVINAPNAIIVRAFAPGGQSTIWGAFCTAFDDNDLRGFPISARDLAQDYKATAERIGLAGMKDDLDGFHGSNLPLLDPLPLSQPARVLLDSYTKSSKREDFKLGYARNAVLTYERGNRGGCVRCGLCLYGCARGSIYNSALELPELSAFPRFTYLQGVEAKKLVSLDGELQAVQVKRAGETFEIKSRKLLLGSGTISTTALLLDYFKRYGEKVRILCNPVAGMAFVVPRFLCEPLPEYGFGLGQLSYRISLDGGEDYATGVVYSADTLPLSLFAERMPLTRPLALAFSAAMVPALLMVTTYLSSDASNVALRLQREADSANIMVESVTMYETREKLHKAGARLRSSFGKLGAYRVPRSLTIAPPGSDAHLAGTVPMGGKDQMSCTAQCELVSKPNVYIIDGSWFPRLPPKHCTFTMMANAHRIGAQLARKADEKALY
jgi:choline dehydrogenase-like flavoprotein